jgi:uncharacterized protein (TIGR02246 family)
MRPLLVATTVLLMLIAPIAAPAAADDKAAITEVFASFARAWEAPGMPGFEALFTEDADFVVISGKWLKGRDVIASYHRELLKGHYSGSKQLPQEVTVRFLTPTIAVAHLVSGANYTKDGEALTRTALATATMVKRDGTWLINAFHNTLTSGPGALLPKNPNL